MPRIEESVAKLGDGPLTEAALQEHIWPLFSRALEGDRARGEIYLANHSLGRPMDQVALDVQEGLDLWYSRMDGSWEDDGWPAAMEEFRSLVARLIGHSDPKAIIPKTSAGQGLRAVLNALPRDGSVRPVRVLATRGEFDSIDFILKAYAEKGRAEVRWVEPSHEDQGVPIFSGAEVAQAVEPGVDLVVLSKAMFSTGQILDGVEAIVASAHGVGALALVDVYHAAGVIPLDFEALGADFMIGGSYKYARGGPGACWLAVHPRHLDGSLRSLDTGWFAKADTFDYRRSDRPEFKPGGDGWLESTPPVLTAYQARAGWKLLEAIGVERLRRYSLEQQAILRGAFRSSGVPCFEPPDPTGFGAFSLVPAEDAKGLARALKDAGVNTDSRGRFVRFGPDILNARLDLERAAEITAEVMAR